MELKLQGFLRSCPQSKEAQGFRLAQLTEHYGIHVKRHPAFPELVQFKYDQIDSPMGDTLVQECRGIILNQDNNWAIVAEPFHKFFNDSEGLAAKIDWPTASVLEKIDGSLIIFYFYKGSWHVATSGTPDAGGDVSGLKMTFADLFWKTYAATGMPTGDADEVCGPGHKVGELDRLNTYCFELTSPYNRIVVPHQDCKLTLIGIRNNITGQELPVSSGPTNWPKVRSFPLGSMSEVVASFADFRGVNQEGYVVVDGNFNRIKIKHPDYVNLHHMRGEGAFTTKRALQLVLSGEVNEVLAYFPEWTEQINDVLSRFSNLIFILNSDYARIKDIPIQKDFALEACKTACPSALFSMRSKKHSSIETFLRDMRLESVVELLHLRELQ